MFISPVSVEPPSRSLTTTLSAAVCAGVGDRQDVPQDVTGIGEAVAVIVGEKTW
jgi:hypothetical protein